MATDKANIPAFPLGQTDITSNARDRIHTEDIRIGLERHARGDWGELCAEDRQSNDEALRRGGILQTVGHMLQSVYHDRHGTEFWVLSDGDRGTTTVLLPEDY
jgi:hypothetical protein